MSNTGMMNYWKPETSSQDKPNTRQLARKKKSVMLDGELFDYVFLHSRRASRKDVHYLYLLKLSQTFINDVLKVMEAVGEGVYIGEDGGIWTIMCVGFHGDACYSGGTTEVD